MIKTFSFRDMSAEDVLSRAVFAGGVEESVAAIIEDVKKNGDAAVRNYTEKFDGVRLSSLEV